MFYFKENLPQLKQTKMIPSVSFQFKVRTVLQVCLSAKYQKTYTAELDCLPTQLWTNLGSVMEALENKSFDVMVFKVLTLPILLLYLFLSCLFIKFKNHLRAF